LRDALGLPTFEFGEVTLYKRITLVLAVGHVVHTFFPVFPPDRNAQDVVAWLRARESA
jgi:peroxiredoxin